MTTRRNDGNEDVYQYFRYVNEINLIAIFNMLEDYEKELAQCWPYLFINTVNYLLFIEKNITPGSKYMQEIQSVLHEAEENDIPNDALYLNGSFGSEAMQDYTIFLGKLRRKIGSEVGIKPALSLAIGGM